MKSICRIVLAGVLMLFPAFSLGGEVYEHVTYWGYIEESETIGWQAGAAAISDVTEHVLELYSKEKDYVVAVIKTTHPTTQATFTFPHLGHFTVKAKSCHNTGDPPVYTCSVWTESTDKERAQVCDENNENCEAKSWWIYRHISPPAID